MERDAKVTFSLLLAIIIGCTAFALSLAYFFDEPLNTESTFTMVYTNINVPEAKSMIENNTNLTIIDVRGLEGCGNCEFKKGHLPGAVLNSNPYDFYNSTNDILVYSINGIVGEEFCQNLTGYVYGNIFNLEGGYENWKN
jgi:rhodanese-related sulfurtransferase